MLKPVALILALSLASATGAAAQSKDDEIMSMTALKWAGINCGQMIPQADYQAALEYTNKLEPKQAASAMKRLKFMVSKASSREVACQSIVDTMKDG